MTRIPGGARLLHPRKAISDELGVRRVVLIVESDGDRGRDVSMGERLEFTEEDRRDELQSSTSSHVGAVKLDKQTEPESSVEAIESSYRRCSSDLFGKYVAGKEGRTGSPGDFGEGDVARISRGVKLIALLRNTALK